MGFSAFFPALCKIFIFGFCLHPLNYSSTHGDLNSVIQQLDPVS